MQVKAWNRYYLSVDHSDWYLVDADASTVTHSTQGIPTVYKYLEMRTVLNEQGYMHLEFKLSENLMLCTGTVLMRWEPVYESVQPE